MQAQSLANGAEGRSPTDRNAIDWHEVKRTVSNQRQCIFRGELLEPCAEMIRPPGSQGRAAQ